MIIFKSKIYREEITYWTLIVVLVIWGLISSFLALRNTQKTILIGLDDSGARLISDSKDHLIKSELKIFLKYFLDQYYFYDEVSFKDRMGVASELMSIDLWEKEKQKLLELKNKLEKTTLSQTAEIETIDLVDQDKVEAILKLHIKSRLSEQQIRLKVNLEFKKIDRSENNPWNYQIMEISDAVL